MRSSTHSAVVPPGTHVHAAPAIGGSAVAALSLPLVGAEASTDQFLANAHRAKLAALAVDLLDMNLLPRRKCKTDLAGAVVQGVGKWLDTMFGGMAWHSLQAGIHHTLYDAMGVTEEMLDNEYRPRYPGPKGADKLYERACGFSRNTPHFVVALAPREWRFVRIRDGVERLEAELPGLGWAAVEAFGNAAVPIGAKDFSWVEYAIQYSQWGGNETCAAYLEENGESEEDFGGITDAQFQTFAPLARMRAAPKLTLQRLQEAAESGTPYAANVAGLLVAMHALRRAMMPCNETPVLADCSLQTSIEPTVFVIWHDEDPICRIADDFHEIVASGDDFFTESTAYIPIRLDRPGGLQRTAKKWQSYLDRLRLADQLLTALAVEGETA